MTYTEQDVAEAEREFTSLILFNKTDSTLIDCEDLDKTKDINWFVRKPYRAGKPSYVLGYTKDKKRVFLHRIIMGVTERKTIVDHINHDGLDNRKINLRVCTQQENGFNKDVSKVNKTGYKGVYMDSKTGKYRSQIGHNYKKIHLGSFDDLICAARAYDDAAIKYYGRFAKLNLKETYFGEKI